MYIPEISLLLPQDWVSLPTSEDHERLIELIKDELVVDGLMKENSEKYLEAYFRKILMQAVDQDIQLLAFVSHLDLDATEELIRETEDGGEPMVEPMTAASVLVTLRRIDHSVVLEDLKARMDARHEIAIELEMPAGRTLKTVSSHDTTIPGTEGTIETYTVQFYTWIPQTDFLVITTFSTPSRIFRDPFEVLFEAMMHSLNVTFKEVNPQ